MTQSEKTLRELFPGINLSALNEIGIEEAARVAEAVSESGDLGKIDFGIIAGYALAYQRWVELSREVSALKTKTRTLRKGDLDIHPLVIAEQKHFVVFRHWCQALEETFKDKSGGLFPPPASQADDDELENYLDRKSMTKDDPL